MFAQTKINKSRIFTSRTVDAFTRSTPISTTAKHHWYASEEEEFKAHIAVIEQRFLNFLMERVNPYIGQQINIRDLLFSVCEKHFLMR